jgi:hypothetical protein
VLKQDSTRLSVLVVWEHVTQSDRKMGIPTMPVLARIPDRRALQFWDADRVLSYDMRHDLPREVLPQVAEMDSTDFPIIWDCVALFRPGARWDKRFPTPDWAGRPVADVIATFRQRLAALEESTAVKVLR